MPIRTIVTDLDGTLLNAEIALSPYTVATLRRAQDAGIGIIVASGRMVESILPFARALGTPLPIIACNGALIADSRTGETLRADCLPPDLALAVARVLEAEGCYFHGYDAGGYYYAEANADSDYYHRATSLTGRAVGPLSAFITQDTPKLLAIAAPQEVHRLQSLLLDRFAGVLNVTNSQQTLLEITTLTATKGNALRTLLARLDIDPATVAAFGDGGNDISMLAAAGMAVAMANAQETLKQVASHICDSHAHDGVARFVEQYLLEGRP